MKIVQADSSQDGGCAQAYRPLGLAALLRQATAGTDLTPLGQDLLEYVQHDDDPYALLDLSLVLQLKYQKPAGLAVQAQALQMRGHYRLQNASPAGAAPQPVLKVLVLKAPGDLMANTPLECLLEQADLQIDAWYLDAGSTTPPALPPHDVLMVAACASDENAGFLAHGAALVDRATGPVLNRPEGIAKTTRDAAYALLGKAPGICMAHTVRLSRERLGAAAQGAFELSGVIDGHYPFIVRPVGSHAGQGLAKVCDACELAQYMAGAPEVAEYYVAPFIDYRSADGLFRKYRIVMIDGRPWVCHMGISNTWMVHYPYAEMLAHDARRAEEARFMASFDSAFAMRHGAALQGVARLTGLDYVGFDCAETGDGRLLIFEIATGMVVHDMDDPQMFPYKGPQMRRVFDAFQAMLRRAALGLPSSDQRLADPS